jgi:hypothetical protein
MEKIIKLILYLYSNCRQRYTKLELILMKVILKFVFVVV